MTVPPLNITVRIGCHVAYQAPAPTSAIITLTPQTTETQRVREQILTLNSMPLTHPIQDAQGNMRYRSLLTAGQNVIHHDALVAVSARPDDQMARHALQPLHELPADLLRYTLPSRYCDTDKLLNFAWEQFGQSPRGVEQVQAICDWIHENIEYRFGSGRPDLAASEIIARRYGVCRDFAHVAVALCRAFNLPARYVTGHLPDIGYIDPGTPMDFHAYFEVYLGDQWYTFDARYNVPRIGRVKMAHGLDAVENAFATIYGAAQLTHFEVWAYQVDPSVVAVGDPIDLSKRLDGDLEVRLSERNQASEP